VEKTSNSGVKIGDRVGCFLSVVGRSALFLGWGTYVGDEVPPNEGQSSMTPNLTGLRRANPKLVLDSGDVVWGCECWWGPEAEIKAEYEKMEQVTTITMAEARLGKIPEGFEAHWGPQQGASQDDDFYGNAKEQDKGFWS